MTAKKVITDTMDSKEIVALLKEDNLYHGDVPPDTKNDSRDWYLSLLKRTFALPSRFSR